MKSAPQTPVESQGLKHLAWLCQPVVRWAVATGVGHKHFAQLLKPMFLREAEKRLAQQNRSLTDSALALVSGLHRGDVKEWRQEPTQEFTWDQLNHEISLGDQVLANWALAKLPATIPYKSGRTSDLPEATETAPATSFCDLIQRTPKVASHGFSAQLILQDMVHRGLVTEHDDEVTLKADRAAAANIEAMDHAMHHLSAAQKDLLATGLYNIQSRAEHRFLEESLEIDGLHSPSVHAFHDAAQKQWQATLAQLLPLAHQLSNQDEPQGGRHRLRLGIYFYTDEEPSLDARVREHDGLDARVREHDGLDARVREHDGPDARVREHDGPDARVREHDGLDARVRGHDGLTSVTLANAGVHSHGFPIKPGMTPSTAKPDITISSPCPATTGHPSFTEPGQTHVKAGLPPPQTV